MRSAKRNFLKGLLIIFSLWIFSSCTEEDIADGEGIYFESISQHYLSTGEELSEQQLLIRDQESWAELLSQMESVNEQSKYFSRTEFYFSEEILLVVLDKVKTNGRHSIEITRLLEAKSQISAIVEKPEKGNATTMVMKPYPIISIEKTKKYIGFLLKY